MSNELINGLEQTHSAPPISQEHGIVPDGTMIKDTDINSTMREAVVTPIIHRPPRTADAPTSSSRKHHLMFLRDQLDRSILLESTVGSVCSTRACASHSLGDSSRDDSKSHPVVRHHIHKSYFDHLDGDAATSGVKSLPRSESSSTSTQKPRSSFFPLMSRSTTASSACTSSQSASASPRTSKMPRNIYSDMVQRSGSAGVEAHLARIRKVCEQYKQQQQQQINGSIHSCDDGIAPPESECRILEFWADDVYYQVVITKNDGISTIIEAIRVFSPFKNMKFESLCVSLLYKLIQENESNRQTVKRLGGDEVIAILRKHLSKEIMEQLFLEDTR